MKNRLLVIGIFALLLTALGFIGWHSQIGTSDKVAVISVDPQTKFQTITGWEATAQVGATVSEAFPYYKKELFDAAVYDLGITRLRVEIKSSTENPIDYFALLMRGPGVPSESESEKRHNPVNDNADPFVINPNGFHFSELDFKFENIVMEMKRRLEKKGERLMINVDYVDFVSSPFEHKNSAEEYAEFVEATYLHLRQKYGIVPDTWEIALEADNGGWSARQLADAMIATAKRLRARGFIPRFVAPSATNMSRALQYLDEMIAIPGVQPDLWEFSYHRYAGVSRNVLEQIGESATRYGVRTAMLEHIGSGYQSLHQDLEIGKNSCWQQYTLAYPGTTDDGTKYYLIDDETKNAPRLILSKRAKFLRQYFKFIRPGALRINATSSARNFDPLAFVNTNGAYVVVIKTKRGGPVVLQHLPQGTYGIKYTTADQYDVDLPERNIQSGQQLKAEIPDSGVITIYRKDFEPGFAERKSK